MKLHHKIFGTAMIAAAAVVSCTDLSDLEQRVDSLENRIAAIETQLEGLNGNIEALGTFAENNKTISNVAYDETSNEWTLTLSDNTTITLDQGSEGNTPVVSLDEDRYWMVDYNDGNGPQYLLVGGEKVQAGTNPVFGVDDSGNWTVSYGGETPVQVTDSEGNPVSALGEGSTGSFFSEVTYNEAEGTFTVTLASDGQSYTLPVVAGFICAIDDVDYDVTELFEYGDSRTYQMTVSGVSEIMTFSPDGWTAIVNEADGAYSLVITAPAQTRAIIADSRTDVTVLAMSASGFATMAKIQVELTDAPIAATATVRAVSGTETENSLTYTVSPDTRTTSWSYIHQLASAEAPTAESEGWTAGSNTTLTIDGLEANTEYTLYVLPYRDETPGEIASATATTSMHIYETYYEMYEDGLDITIAGKVYNKETYGEATLVSEDASITSTTGITKVFFVDNDATLTYNTTDAPNAEKAIYQLIIIGNTPGQRSNMLLNSQIALNQGAVNTDGTFVAYNLDIDASNAGNYPFAQNRDGAYGYVGIIDCHFVMPSGRNLTYVSSTARSYSEFAIEDSEIEIPSANQVLFFSFSNSEASHGTISLKNNILYSENGVSDFRIISGTGCSFSNFVFENNTVVNLWSTTAACALYSSLNTVSVTKNLFWTNRTTANMAFFRPTDTSAGAGTPYTGNPTGTLVDDSIVYKNGETTNWQWFFGGMNRVNREGFDACNEIVAVDTDPLATKDFENGIFTPTGNYSQYGAHRD